MRQYIQRGIRGFSLIIASAVFLGCRNDSGLEKTTEDHIPQYSAIEKNNKPSIYLENAETLGDDKISQTLENKCTKKAPQKIQEITYERFKQKKLKDRYNSLSDEEKRFFDRVYGPHDWKLLNDIYNDPDDFIEKVSKFLETPNYLARYRDFKKKALKDLPDESKQSVKKIVPVIDLNKPTDFDIAAAFYILELKKEFSVFGVKRKNK